jgi:hypothetical protein
MVAFHFFERKANGFTEKIRIHGDCTDALAALSAIGAGRLAMVGLGLSRGRIRGRMLQLESVALVRL